MQSNACPILLNVVIIKYYVQYKYCPVVLTAVYIERRHNNPSRNTSNPRYANQTLADLQILTDAVSFHTITKSDSNNSIALIPIACLKVLHIH
jgi:hypothetical protein